MFFRVQSVRSECWGTLKLFAVQSGGLYEIGDWDFWVMQQDSSSCPVSAFWRNALFCRVPVQAVGFMVLFGSGSVSGSGSKADLLRQNV